MLEVSLLQKLGIKAGMRVQFINPPKHYHTLIGHPSVLLANSNLDFVHIFTKTELELNRLLKTYKSKINKMGMLWLSWPKASSGVATDLNENKVRDSGLKIGLVDVKVAAIDETWSGLKFIYRLKDR